MPDVTPPSPTPVLNDPPAPAAPPVVPPGPPPVVVPPAEPEDFFTGCMEGRGLSSATAESLQRDLQTVFGADAAHKAAVNKDVADIYLKDAELSDEVEGQLAPQRNNAIAPEHFEIFKSALVANKTKKLDRLSKGILELRKTDRNAIVQRTGDALKNAEFALQLYTDQTPKRMLSLEGMGTESRSRYDSQLAHCGPQELQTHAMAAIQSGNPIYAASIMAANDKLPRAKRAFSSEALAQKVIGKRWAAVINAAKELKFRCQELRERERKHAAGQHDPMAKIRSGLHTLKSQTAAAE
jgi:hypothetical protein